MSIKFGFSSLTQRHFCAAAVLSLSASVAQATDHNTVMEPPLVGGGMGIDIATTVYFRSGSASLDRNDRALLDQALNQVQVFDTGYGMGQTGYISGIDIIGHTDSVGGSRANDRLGLRRATAVGDYYVSRGVNDQTIGVASQGENQPVASNRTRRGRALNRRADVIIRAVQDF